MKRVLLYGFFIFLSACGTTKSEPERRETLYLHYDYFGARNDLGKRIGFVNQSDTNEIDISSNDTNHILVFNMSYMIACNEDVSECKHAVVASNITYRVTNIKGKVVIVGSFNTEVGRSVRVEDEFSYTEKAVPNGVKVAFEIKESTPFSIDVVTGASQTIVGPAGDKVIVTVVDKI